VLHSHAPQLCPCTAFHFFYDSKRFTLGQIPKTSSVQRIEDIKIVLFGFFSFLQEERFVHCQHGHAQNKPGAESGGFTETKNNFFTVLITRENVYSAWSETQKRFAGRRTSCNSEQSLYLSFN